MARPLSHLALLGAALFAGACASTEAAPPGMHVGEQLEPRPIHGLAAVHATPDQYFDQTVWVEAKVVSVCQSKGCWMQVEDGETTALVRWETGCGGKYTFPKDSAGERILIQGSFYPKEVAPEEAEHMQSEAAGQLVVPKKGYEFNASAVVMLDRPPESRT